MTAVNLLEDSNDQVRSVCEKLRDEDLLGKARIHPFNMLVAWKLYGSGRGDKGSLTWTPNPNIIEALESAYYLSFKVGSCIVRVKNRMMHSLEQHFSILGKKKTG